MACYFNKVEVVHMCTVFLYGLDCQALSKMDAHRIDAHDQWCLCMLLGIKWYQFVQNDDVQRLTKQPKLTAIIQSCWLTLFGHIMCMDDNADAGGLEKTTRSSLHHVAQHCQSGCETPPPYAPWSSRFGSEPASVKDDINIWCYEILELHVRNEDDDLTLVLAQGLEFKLSLKPNFRATLSFCITLVLSRVLV